MIHTLRSSLSKWAAAAVIAVAGPVLALQPALKAEKKEQKKAPVVTTTPKTEKAKAKAARPAKTTAAKSSAKGKSAFAPSSAKPKPAPVRLGTAAKGKSITKAQPAAKKLSTGKVKKNTGPTAKSAKPKAAKARPEKKKATELKPTTLHSGKVDLPKPKSTLKPAGEETTVPFNVPPSTQPSVNTLELPEASRI